MNKEMLPDSVLVYLADYPSSTKGDDLVGYVVGAVHGCEDCGGRNRVKPELSRTIYVSEDGNTEQKTGFCVESVPWERRKGNRAVLLCRQCAVKHHADWDAWWAEYRNNKLLYRKAD